MKDNSLTSDCPYIIIGIIIGTLYVLGSVDTKLNGIIEFLHKK